MIPHVVYGQPIDTEGLSGVLSLSLSNDHASWWIKDLHVLLIEQDLGGRRYAGWVSVSRAIVADERAMASAAQIAVDALRPWRRTEPWMGWPYTWTPFPLVAHLGGLLEAGKRLLGRRGPWRPSE